MRIRGLLLALLLAASGLAHGAIILVQHPTPVRCATATTCAITLSGVASGDTILVFPGTGSNLAFSSLTDTNGTVSTCRAWANNADGGAGIYYVSNTASGSHTITLTVTSSGNLEIYAAEYSGMPTSGACDTSSAVATGSTFNPTSASITPAGNNELLVGFIVVASSSVTFGSWGSSLSQVDTVTGGPSSAWAAFVQSTGTSGSATATPSGSNANWVAVAAFFESAAVPPASPMLSHGKGLTSNGNPVVSN